MLGCFEADASSCSSRSSSRSSSPTLAPQARETPAQRAGNGNGPAIASQQPPLNSSARGAAKKQQQLCPGTSTDLFEMPDYVEDLKRSFLIQPKPGETEEEAKQRLFVDLEDHDRLNRELTSTYSHFVRGDRRAHDWHDIPPAEPRARKVAFMFLVMDRHKHEDLWREWFRRADAEGHRDDYSIIYHRGAAYGKTADDIRNDLFAEKGIAVWPVTKTGWARNGLARATLLLQRFGLEDPGNMWFVLLSDHCMPLYSFHEFHQRISREDVSRFNDFGVTLDMTMRRDIWERGFCTTIRRSNKADQWSMVVRADAEWFVKEKHYQHLKPMAVFVDEGYFMNMMDQHSRPYKNVPTTYTKWYHTADLPGLDSEDRLGDLKKMGSSPHTFKMVDMRIVRSARRSGAWFMRKVAAGVEYPELDELELGSDDEAQGCVGWP